MFCKNCGQKREVDQKKCIVCKTVFTDAITKETEVKEVTEKKSFWSIGRIIFGIFILFSVGSGIYGNLDEGVVEKNNDGLASYEIGDNESAIIQLEQAKNEAVTDVNKILTLMNLAYVYEDEGDIDNALNSFTEALEVAKENSFDYYLIMGEIALLENKPNSAIISFQKAYELKPEDFQINNTLTLFYLNLDGMTTAYEDDVKALEHAHKSFDNDPDKSEIIKHNLAIAHLFNGNNDEVISLMSTTNFEHHPYMAYWLGIAYMNIGDDINAKKTFQISLDNGEELEPELNDYFNSI